MISAPAENSSSAHGTEPSASAPKLDHAVDGERHAEHSTRDLSPAEAGRGAQAQTVGGEGEEKPEHADHQGQRSESTFGQGRSFESWVEKVASRWLRAGRSHLRSAPRLDVEVSLTRGSSRVPPLERRRPPYRAALLAGGAARKDPHLARLDPPRRRAGRGRLRVAESQGPFAEYGIRVRTHAAANGEVGTSALVPLALGGHRAGSEIQTPMAIVILFGLISSTLLNMVVVPTLYLRYGGTSSA